MAARPLAKISTGYEMGKTIQIASRDSSWARHETGHRSCCGWESDGLQKNLQKPPVARREEVSSLHGYQESLGLTASGVREPE